MLVYCGHCAGSLVMHTMVFIHPFCGYLYTVPTYPPRMINDQVPNFVIINNNTLFYSANIQFNKKLFSAVSCTYLLVEQQMERQGIWMYTSPHLENFYNHE